MDEAWKLDHFLCPKDNKDVEKWPGEGCNIQHNDLENMRLDLLVD